MHRFTRDGVVWVLGALLGHVGCGGSTISDAPDFSDAGPLQPIPDAAGAERVSEGGTPDRVVVAELDPGYVGPRRLSRREYLNTVRDLVGLTFSVEQLLPDELIWTFDNMYEGSGFERDPRPEYLAAARAITGEVFADPALRSRIVTCTPDGSPDSTLACARTNVRAFGRRAFRRPLTEAEVEDFVAIAALAGPLDDFDAMMRRVVTAMLSSKPFLFRIEVDPDPASTKPHPVTPYELASRLSYLIWSTMPDDALFAAAADGSLVLPDVLSAQLRRMLADPQADRFVRDFGGLWLGGQMLSLHEVDPRVFPTFDEPLRASMLEEMRRYLSEFMNERSFGEFLTADMNFVDERLAKHYGFASIPLAGVTSRVEVRDDKRRGYLSLAGFLTATSHPYRTTPMQRGKWILENVLCLELAPPPPDVPDIRERPPNESIRAYFESVGQQPPCGGCHVVADGLGFGLQDFDAIGNYRTLDERGYKIDASGVTPGGEKFDGAGEVGVALSKDPRFLACATRNAIMYAIGRMLEDADQVYVERMLDQWRPSLRLANLLEQIVMSDPFRKRRGKTP